MTHTVHLDRQGYVDTVFQNTKKETLDARKYPGTLMEVTGDVVPGWRWDGQRFVLPPPRIPASDVRSERDRRINTPFPERLIAQVTAFGGKNAVNVSTYVKNVYAVAEAMGDDAPADYRDDRHWPRVPSLDDMPVPVRVPESVSPVASPPITVNVHTGQQEPKALVVHREHVNLAPEPVQREDNLSRTQTLDEYGLDRADPLYPRKQRLIQFIEREVEPRAPADEAWRYELGRLAALHTDAQSVEQLEVREAEIMTFLEGKAA